MDSRGKARDHIKGTAKPLRYLRIRLCPAMTRASEVPEAVLTPCLQGGGGPRSRGRVADQAVPREVWALICGLPLRDRLCISEATLDIVTISLNFCK